LVPALGRSSSGSAQSIRSGVKDEELLKDLIVFFLEYFILFVVSFNAKILFEKKLNTEMNW
jgi:hypothetical protein